MRRSPTDQSRGARSAARSKAPRYGQYDSPEKLAHDARISPTVRVRLLNDWAEDLTATLRATDENMRGADPGRAGDLLRRVHVCLEELEPPSTRH